MYAIVHSNTSVQLIVCVQAFHKGIGVFAEHLMDVDFLHSVKLTLMLAAVSQCGF